MEDPATRSVPATASVQERHAPRSICFGCGPANAGGLHVRSFRDGDRLIASWQADAVHQAFPGVVNGGIIGSLLDCHANWAAALALMDATGAAQVPATVTAEYEVRMHRPTPADRPVTLLAQVRHRDGRRVRVEASIEVDGATTATFAGTFVAVEPGHPAYHRWD